MKLRTMLLTTVFALSAGMGLAITNDEIISGLQAEGFTRIEIKTGPTQIKVEAIRGTEKREIVYDAATGAVLKIENETVNAGDDTAPGIEIDVKNKDFVRGNDSDDDSSDDDSSDDNGGDRGDDDSDDSGYDDNGGDRGDDDSDDDRDDDKGGDRGGDDDKGGDRGNDDRSDD